MKWARTFLAALAMFFLLGQSSPGLDSPLPAPSRLEFKSKAGTIKVVSDPVSWVTIVFRELPGGKEERLWSMIGSFRYIVPLDDGDKLIIDYGNLLTLDFKQENPVCFLVDRGRIQAIVKVKDLVKDKSELSRTVSHYDWGHSLGLYGNKYYFEVRTGKVFALDTKDGTFNASPRPSEQDAPGR